MSLYSALHKGIDLFFPIQKAFAEHSVVIYYPRDPSFCILNPENLTKKP